MTKIIYKVLSVLAIVFCILLFLYQPGIVKKSITINSITSVASIGSSTITVPSGVELQPKAVSETLDSSSAQNQLVATIQTTLRIGTTTYTASVPKGSSVYDAMTIFASTTPFRFEAKNYPSLGYFIEKINGISNSNGTYWTLYVNGAYSPVGASAYQLKAGDSIEWKYEKK